MTSPIWLLLVALPRGPYHTLKAVKTYIFFLNVGNLSKLKCVACIIPWYRLVPLCRCIEYIIIISTYSYGVESVEWVVQNIKSIWSCHLFYVATVFLRCQQSIRLTLSILLESNPTVYYENEKENDIYIYIYIYHISYQSIS